MFKHTGIIRRMDEFGRVVIPKEIRRKYRLCEGDPIEIGIGEDVVMLRKYSVLELFNDTTEKLLRVFEKTTKVPVILCSTSHILRTFGMGSCGSDNYIRTELADGIKDGSCSCRGLPVTQDSKLKVEILERIMINGSVEGALIIPQCNPEITDAHKECLHLCAGGIAALLD